MLRARSISWQKDGKSILQDIDLALARGEWLGLLGPNGSGKSSLLKILACLEPPSAGSLVFKGREISRPVPLEIRRKIAVVFQESLLLNATVYDNVALGLKLRGVRGKVLRARVGQWLDKFGITHLARQHANTLSGGEAQRASLARAFVLEPDVIFLDEPFSSLDAPTKEALVNDLVQISRSAPTAALLVSHDFRDIQRLTSRAVILLQGRVAAEASPAELLRSTQPAAVEAFIAYWRHFEYSARQV